MRPPRGTSGHVLFFETVLQKYHPATDYSEEFLSFILLEGFGED